MFEQLCHNKDCCRTFVAQDVGGMLSCVFAAGSDPQANEGPSGIGAVSGTGIHEVSNALREQMTPARNIADDLDSTLQQTAEASVDADDARAKHRTGRKHR